MMLTSHGERLEKLKNAKPNMNVLKEYRKREEEFLRRAKDLEDITIQRDEQKQVYDALRKKRLDEFMTGFSLISMKLKEMYQVRFVLRELPRFH
jgi:structural maintenance of chromosome 4